VHILALFFSLFTFLVVVIFNLAVDDIGIIVTVQSGAMFIALCVIWNLFYGARILQFYKMTDMERSTFDATRKSSVTTDSTNGSNMPQKGTQMRTRGSSEMPTYVNDLYDQQGFRGSTTIAGNEHSVAMPSVVMSSAAGPLDIIPQDGTTVTSNVSEMTGVSPPTMNSNNSDESTVIVTKSD